MRIVLFLCLTFALAVVARDDVCGNIENCGKCDHWYDYSVTGVSWVTNMGPAQSQFSDSMKKALEIMKSFDESKIKSNDIFQLHMSIQYLCCYFTSTYTKIATAMQAVKWEPIPIYFDKIICNHDPGASTTSFIVTVSYEGQEALLSLAQSFEAAIEQAGVPVHKTRDQQQPFHSTLAVVNEGYPLDDAIKAINEQIDRYNQDPLIVDTFVWLTVPPFTFNTTQKAEPQVMYEFKATSK